MSAPIKDLESFLPEIASTFDQAAHPQEGETATVKTLAFRLLMNNELWQALADSPDTETKQTAREYLFGFLRIAQNDENSRIPRQGIVRVRQLVRQIRSAVKNRDFAQFIPGNQSWSFQETVAYIRQIQTRRDQLHMTVEDSLTPDGGVIYPPLEAVQDDLRTHTLLGKARVGLAKWENHKKAALDDLEQIESRLSQETPTGNLSQTEQQYLGILAALAVFYLRFAQLLGRLDFLEDSLDIWSAYDQYLQARIQTSPEATDLKKNLNKDRLMAITNQALLGSLTIVDLDIRARFRVRQKARRLHEIAHQGVYLEEAP